MPALNALAGRAYDAASTFADKVHFVHVYVIDPHPMAPDPGPYAGVVSEAAYSTIRQPKTYAERVAAARQTRALLTGRQAVIVDDLNSQGAVNPIWCTYGTCPNCAFLVSQDGTLSAVQTWFNATQMEQAIRQLVK